MRAVGYRWRGIGINNTEIELQVRESLRVCSICAKSFSFVHLSDIAAKNDWVAVGGIRHGGELRSDSLVFSSGGMRSNSPRLVRIGLLQIDLTLAGVLPSFLIMKLNLPGAGDSTFTTIQARSEVTA